MPEEEKTELESNGKLVKEIRIDSEMVDKFWIEDSKTYYSKPEKGMLGTLIFNDFCDESVILLMGSDCGAEDLIMEGEVFSEASDAISLDYEPITRSMVLREKLNGGDFDAKLLRGKDQQEENKSSQVVNKVAEATNTMAASTIGESKSQEQSEDVKIHNLETENMISFGRAVHENINGICQYSGTLPYSGSVSLRSTSSTASTQSFAFPILAQEWNNSPVRMAKPDMRQLRKQKSWKMKIGCLCCRF